MKKVIKLFKKNYGYAYLQMLKNNGIHTDTIRILLEQGIIERVKPGLYKLVDFPVVAEQGMIDLCLSMKRAVVCLHSALSYHDLTTTVPAFVMIALPRGSKAAKVIYPPFQVFYFSDNNYHSGIEESKTSGGSFRVYNPEKTIVDCFRYRKRLGEDLALEGLRKYLTSRNVSINKLVEYAKKGRLYNVMEPYMKASLAI